MTPFPSLAAGMFIIIVAIHIGFMEYRIWLLETKVKELNSQINKLSDNPQPRKENQ